MNATYYITILFFICLFSSSNTFAQSKKEIRERKIHTIKVYEERPQKYNDKLLESVTTYNTSGNVIEEIKYNNDGELKSHEKYEYDEYGNKIKETKLNSSGDIIETIIYKYSNGLRTERTEYDEKGKITSRRTYFYETD